MRGVLVSILLLLAVGVMAGEFSLYGVCAHVTRGESSPERIEATIQAMRMAGLRSVRSDFDSRRILRRDGSYDFSFYDAIVARFAENGITVLPILYSYDGNKVPADLDRYRAYIKAIVRHYGTRLPVVEIWNEPNLDMFFPGADPVVYAKILATAYAAIKEENAGIQVAFGGLSGIPIDWIRKSFEAGAATGFDIMNVHPYSHPKPPEGLMDVKTEQLKDLMATFDCAEKPLWYTEIGWPTQSISLEYGSILLAGLNVARPERKSWRVLVADCATSGTPDQALARALLELLPPGSTAVVCNQPETIRRMKERAVDALVYPFDETFPADTLEAALDFIAAGGVFVDFSGIPCFYGRRDNEEVAGLQRGAAVKRMPFGFRTAGSDRKGTYPKETTVFATPVGLKAGVRQEPTGFVAKRYLAPDRIGAQSEWIPLLSGRGPQGDELVAAAVIRYRGERKGAAVLSTLFPSQGLRFGSTEVAQAQYTARSLGITFAENVSAYFAYNLRAKEEDPFYSEHHFGLMHAGFQPKPAYTAYMTFVQMRPVGSVTEKGVWHDAAQGLYYPTWRRPDGAFAGMLWSSKGERRIVLTADQGEPVFFDMNGRRQTVRQTGRSSWTVLASASPIYFTQAKLLRVQGLLSSQIETDNRKE